MRVLVAGAGYVGTRLAEELADAGHEAICLRRSRRQPPRGAASIQADLSDAGSLQALPHGLDHIMFCAAPDKGDEPGYVRTYREGLHNLLGVLESRSERPVVFFTSSTSVYAQDDGSLVDEVSETQPGYYSGQVMLEAEERLRASPLPHCIARCGGIYGPTRTRLLETVRTGQATYDRTTESYTNRIHRDDIAGALQFLMEHDKRDDLYVFVDSDPAPREQVLRWLAEQLGAPPPRGVPESDRGRRGRRSNKRCSNARLLATGYRFRFPSFRQGYRAMLEVSRGPSL